MSISRRAVLSGLAAAPIATAAVATEELVDPYKQVQRDAMALAASMQAIHGGNWHTLVNHKHHMVAVSQIIGNPAEALHRVIGEDGTNTDTWLPVRAG